MTNPYQAHSATSKAAAEQAESDGQTNDIVRLFQRAGENGHTADEIAVLMAEIPRWRGIQTGTVAARLAALKGGDRVEPMIYPKGVTRETRAKRQAEVWVHADHANEFQKAAPQSAVLSKRALVRADLDTVYRFINGLVSGGQIKDAIYARRAPEIAEIVQSVIEKLGD
jgi:hypothetical protein